MSNSPAFIKTEDHTTVVMPDGDTFTMYVTNENYYIFIDMIQNKQWKLAKVLATPAVQVQENIDERATGQNTRRVRVRNGMIYVDEVVMNSRLTDRMLQMLSEGFDITYLKHFLLNLQENPSFRAVNELYDFLESANLPITEDGCFLAYKRVRGDYTDIYTGKFDNSIGAKCEMKRNEVDEDKSRTCSQGLHFCSREYLPKYGAGPSNKTMMVKINPKDVVAIPKDYNNAKGRCCYYEVVAELDHQNTEELEGLVRHTNSKQFGDMEDRYDEYENEETLEDLDDDLFEPTTEAVRPSQDNRPIGVEKIVWNNGRYEVAERFTTAQEAADCLGLHASNIRKVCNGERNTTGGMNFRWRY